MRPIVPALLFAILLVVPLTGALQGGSVQDATRSRAAPLAPPIPQEFSDADLIRMLAAYRGTHVEVPALREPSAGLTVTEMVQRLGARAGMPVSTEEVGAFHELDPHVAGPLLTLLVAVEQSWDIRDRAFAELSAKEEVRMGALWVEGSSDTAEYRAYSSLVDREQLLRSAILLLDAVEAVVVPQLQEAVRQGAWPPFGIADPVGVLRLGGEGDDVETLNRIIQIDPRGNDQYHNNAGGTTILRDLDPRTYDYPIALSIDFEGNDTYRYASDWPAQGGAVKGVGILLDYEGDDVYDGGKDCQGAGADGVGLLRDYSGTDQYRAGESCTGAGASAGYGILRDDGTGEDLYVVLGSSGGYADSKGHGLLWDRGGTDTRQGLTGGSLNVFGYADGPDTHGWLVDEGPEHDTYGLLMYPYTLDHPCNDCTWTTGFKGGKGVGNDNMGGLPYLMAHQDEGWAGGG